MLHALYNGKADLAERLLNANPALDVFDAAATGRTRGMEELIDAEPELARNWSADGFTPLHYAAFFGQEDAARILLERGAEVEVVARNESIRVTPLHSAAVGIALRDREAAARGGRRPERGPGRRLHTTCIRPLRTTTARAPRRCSPPAPTRRSQATTARRAAQLAGDGTRELFG